MLRVVVAKQFAIFEAEPVPPECNVTDSSLLLFFDIDVKPNFDEKPRNAPPAGTVGVRVLAVPLGASRGDL